MLNTARRTDWSQHQHWNQSHEQFAGRNNLFVEIMQGPNPNSPGEIDRLVTVGRGRYDLFAGFGAAALLEQGLPVPLIRPVPAGWEVGFYLTDPTDDFRCLVVVDDETTARRLAYGWPCDANRALRMHHLGRETFLSTLLVEA